MLIDLTVIGIRDCGDLKADQFILPRPKQRKAREVDGKWFYKFENRADTFNNII